MEERYQNMFLYMSLPIPSVHRFSYRPSFDLTNMVLKSVPEAHNKAQTTRLFPCQGKAAHLGAPRRNALAECRVGLAAPCKDLF